MVMIDKRDYRRKVEDIPGSEEGLYWKIPTKSEDCDEGMRLDEWETYEMNSTALTWYIKTPQRTPSDPLAGELHPITELWNQ